MHRSLLVISLFSLSLYLQSNATVWLGYYALQEEIAAHCENKSNADCSGKCQVKKLETQSEGGALVPIHIPDISEFIVKTFALFSEPLSSAVSFVSLERWRFLEGLSPSVFRPPISA